MSNSKIQDSEGFLKSRLSDASVKIKDVSPINFRDVSRELPTLKMARIDADYKEIEIKKGMSENALDKAIELLTTLNMAFKI